MMKKKIVVIGLIIIFISNIGLFLYLEDYYRESHYRMVEKNLMSYSSELEMVYKTFEENTQYLKMDYYNSIEDRYLQLSNNIINHYNNFTSIEEYLDTYSRNIKNSIVILDGEFSPVHEIPGEMLTTLEFLEKYLDKESLSAKQIISSPYGDIFIRSKKEDLYIVIKLDQVYTEDLAILESIPLEYLKERIGKFDRSTMGMVFDTERELAISNSKVMKLSDGNFYNENRLLLRSSIGKFISMNKYCKETGENKSIYAYVKESSDEGKLIISYIENDDVEVALNKYKKMILMLNFLGSITLLIVGFILYDLLDIGSR
jgi:hypothetical protein